MKRHFTKPGFETIFALSVLVIFCLPLLVLAQEKHEKKHLEIKINNGDTIINGKNIKDLSAADRQQALNDINGFREAFTIEDSDHQRFFIRKKGSDTNSKVFFEKGLGDGNMVIRFDGDTAKHVFRYKHRGPGGKDSLFTFNYRVNPERFRFENPEWSFDMPMRSRSFDVMHRRNSQSFNYTNTGSDGISTHVNFRVMDASPEQAKEMTGLEKGGLELNDLSLVPEFSSGKTVLMFNLPAKTAADVKFTDSEGKTLWSSKAVNGSFNKSFVLGLNGVYYLQVKQAGKVALKRIVKEE